MSTASKEFTGRHMLALAVSFFGVIIAVNVVMAVSAARTWTGLVVENSYVASQEFQAKADALHAQEQAGWTIRIAYEAGQIVIEARDRDGILALDDLSAFIRRPVGGHEDARVSLQLTDGAYRGDIALKPGVWDVTVTSAATPLGAIERETRITVP